MNGKNQASESPRGNAHFDSIGERLAEQRARAAEKFAEHHDRIREIESQLSGSMEGIETRLQAWSDFEEEVARQHEEVGQQISEIERRDAELEAQKHDFAERRVSLANEIKARRAKMLAKQNERILGLENEMDDLRDQIEHEQLAVRNYEKKTLEEAKQQDELRQKHEAELNEARAKLDQAREQERKLRDELYDNQHLLDERTERMNKLRDQLEDLMRQQDEAGQSSEAFAELQMERDKLADELDGLRAQETTGDSLELQQKLQEADKRIDMLTARNESLEQQLIAGGEDGNDEAKLDWEHEKQRLLAELEEDTDAVQNGAVESPARPPAGSFDGADSTDIEAEREKLEQLQEEWQKQMAAAEVKISVERAENARMRNALEEKLRDLEDEMQRVAKKDEYEPNSMRRRWAGRLGLDKD